jgi:Zn-dependent protease
MINEPSNLASQAASDPFPQEPEALAQPAIDPAQELLEATVLEVMDITRVDHNPAPPVKVAFVGRLRVDSETAYAHLDDVFAAHDYHAVLSTGEDGQHLVMAIQGRIRPKARPWWPNAVLLALTLLSLLYAGSAHQAGMEDRESIRLLEGAPYALSMLLILGSHELGHYFAARSHKVNVTLPYFIPAPFSFGTLGAFIQLREPMRNRKVLFDVGVAGPLAGLIVTLPILFIGLATSDIEPLPTETYILEGDSLFYASAKLAVFGEMLPNDQEDVFINQLAKAGWTGLFITGLNLIPLGQLDGGHVIFTLLGRQAQRLYIPVLTGFFLLSLFNPAWLLWTVLLFFLGRAYAVPLDTVTTLDDRRRWLGYVAMGIFVLVFVPDPLHIVSP